MIANPIKYNETDAQTFDKRAKDTVIAILNKGSFHAIENPNKYGIDILLFNNDVFVQSIEVEVKRSFTTWETLYPKVHIPERKRKFFIDDCSFFLLLNLYLDKFILIKGSEVLNCEVMNKFTNRSTVVLDKFFSVPLEKFQKFEIENGELIRIEE